MMRVIAYASRAVTKLEYNYNAFKLKFLALKWAVTEKYFGLSDNSPFFRF
jgi:hypothetical protein